MITSSTRVAGPYTGNGAQTVFSFAFKVFAASDLKVVHTSSLGVETVLTLTTHYTVALNADQDNNPGGTITYPISGSPLPANEKLTITSSIAETQGVVLPSAGGWFPKTVENALDKLTVLVQQIKEGFGRSIKVPISDGMTGLELPTATQRALKFLGFDSAGNPIAAILATTAVTVSAFMETMLDDANAQTARQTLLIDKQGGDVASAATIDLDAVAGDHCDLTGVTTVTAITLAAGITKRTRTTGSLQFTNGASLILPDGLNLVTAAGDVQEWTGYAAGVVRLTDYFSVGSANEVDVQQDDVVLLRDVSTNKIVRVKTQDLHNAIGGMTAFAGAVDIDADTLAIHDASLGAPKQRKIPARIGQVPVRQTVLAGNVDSNGYANFLTTGSGLRPGLLATAIALALTSAAGFDDLGEKNYYERFTSDISDPIGSDLPASNTSYLFRILGSLNIWAKTLVPPQYGYAFDRTQNALLHFEGADTSTTMLDAFGNTWTASGNAQIDTAQFKFGASSLLLDGTGDYVDSTDFTTLGPDSWEISCWVRWNALPGSGAAQTIFNFGQNASEFGAWIQLGNIAGTTKLEFYASSNGSSFDIANQVLGSTTTWSANIWYKIRVVFDALAGTYRVYLSNNGAAESQELSVSSTARVAGGSRFRIGRKITNIADFNGWLDEFRFIRCASKTATETPQATQFVPSQINETVTWFSLAEMKFYYVNTESGAAGTNPGLLTQPNGFVFLGEADTSGAAVTAVRSYALRGEYVGPQAAFPGVSTSATVQHNIGVVPKEIDLIAVNLTTSQGFTPGDEIRLIGGTTATYQTAYQPRATRRELSFATTNSTALAGPPKTGGDNSDLVNTRWNYRLEARRGW